MRGRKPRRRLRVRRKRKGEDIAKEVLVSAGDVVGDRVIGEFCGCVFEAVVSSAVLLALLTVPAYLLLSRVT